jgi:hypothetical protein
MTARKRSDTTISVDVGAGNPRRYSHRDPSLNLCLRKA